MSEYTNIYDYDRGTTAGGRYAVDHPDRTEDDGQGGQHQIRLGREVQDTWPDKKFITRCSGSNLRFLFENPLTTADQGILETLVENHKNNV